MASGISFKQPNTLSQAICCRTKCSRTMLSPPSPQRRCVVVSSSSTPQPPSEPYVTFDFSCPICHSTQFQLSSVNGKPTGSLSCPRCARTFRGGTDDATTTSPGFVDLTLTSGVEQRAFNQKLWGGTQIFRNPLVSLAYERGWRQSFSWAGFPGVDKEYEMAMERLQPAYGQVLVDMSCGSGLFSRRFVSSGKFAGVIAADYSETMLKEAKQYFEETFLTSERYILARMDVARLPFATGSVAAIHAGAALHCWPDPLAALAEISRVLRPGGVFVGTTFLKVTSPLGEIVGDDVIRPLTQVIDGVDNQTGNMRWWEEQEIRDLAASVGLQAVERERSFRFIMFSMVKPGA